MADAGRPLRILMTNNTLASRAGSELYLLDLAVALMKKGHFPVAYSPELGEVAEELSKRTIPVIDDLREMTVAPDVIHGQHHHETMTAALRYPHVPVVYICHGWAPWQEAPPAYPTIMSYVAVDDLCRERLLTTHGISPQRITTLYNFVDLQKFQRIRTLPDRPKSALVFSNHASEVSDAIRSACERCGIERIDVVGIRSGNRVAHPEKILADYDIVFAKARAAIEAMASGCAVIVTDYAGLAGMVTTDNVDRLRGLNFGVRSMQANVLTSETVQRELERYDARDARHVTDRIRKDADLDPVVDRWISIYHQVERTWAETGESVTDVRKLQAASEYLRSLSPRLKSAIQNEQLRNALESERNSLTREVKDYRARSEALAAEMQASARGVVASIKSSALRAPARFVQRYNQWFRKQ
ncbi:glycosyltransferase [Breoghania sp. L-A4]|uniref:glycosyltransferase n=1 Tax=Breoghania sp. L-A4 TaxID=2304600 RepID=UPI0013C35D14|nr:glycosyltransferase [Breoghania sp. L-A4]